MLFSELYKTMVKEVTFAGFGGGDDLLLRATTFCGFYSILI